MATVGNPTVEAAVSFETPEELPIVTTGKDGKKRKRSDSTVQNYTVEDLPTVITGNGYW